jgi:hypothetical protein
VARSLALKVMLNCVELTDVGVWGTALKLTVEAEAKFVPLMVSVCAAVPIIAEFGESPVMAGTG